MSDNQKEFYKPENQYVTDYWTNLWSNSKEHDRSGACTREEQERLSPLRDAIP